MPMYFTTLCRAASMLKTLLNLWISAPFCDFGKFWSLVSVFLVKIGNSTSFWLVGGRRVHPGPPLPGAISPTGQGARARRVR